MTLKWRGWVGIKDSGIKQQQHQCLPARVSSIATNLNSFSPGRFRRMHDCVCIQRCGGPTVVLSGEMSWNVSPRNTPWKAGHFDWLDPISFMQCRYQPALASPEHPQSAGAGYANGLSRTEIDRHPYQHHCIALSIPYCNELYRLLGSNPTTKATTLARGELPERILQHAAIFCSISLYQAVGDRGIVKDLFSFNCGEGLSFFGW